MEAKTIVKQAEAWLGIKETNNGHKEIIDTYNSHKPLARGYKVKLTDSWCAAFVSAVSIKCGATDIIPTECSCQKMIELFKKKGTWVENENRVPNAGDIIFYDWQDSGAGDNQGWSDHVGIVQKADSGKIYVIEGNYSNSVKIRELKVNDRYIRGYGVPKYSTTTNNNVVQPEQKPTEKEELKIGDKCSIAANATYFNGKSIPAWVKASTLYYRGLRKDGFAIISVFATGAITGAIDKKYLIKK